jgi:hypothetical protein
LDQTESDNDYSQQDIEVLGEELEKLCRDMLDDSPQQKAEAPTSAASQSKKTLGCTKEQFINQIKTMEEKDVLNLPLNKT